MPNAKIEIKLGDVSFAGEGEQAWLETQMRYVLERAIQHPSGAGAKREASHSSKQDTSLGDGKTGSLAAFLKSHGASTNQVKKFLATAAWLQLKGSARPTTSAVTKALQDSHQSRLGNPADCLNQNVRKGFCEKVGKEFYVTDEGQASLNAG